MQGLGLPGVTSREAVAAATAVGGGLGLPGVTSREAAAAAGGGLGLPGIISRDGVGLGLPGVAHRTAAERPPERPTNYVTDTITTPQNRESQAGGRVSQRGFVQVDGSAGRVPVTGLPKWARQSSLGSSGLSGLLPDPDTPSHKSSQVSSAAAPPSLASSVNSSSFLGPTRFDSSVSIHWSPQNVLVQSWHRTLSETYTDYNMVNMVGSGQHGAVFIVQHKRSERYYACKVMNKDSHEPEALRREIASLRRLDHPNIVRLYETLEDRDTLCLLMELCLGGDLFSRVAEERRLTEQVARVFAEQLLSALAYCHSMGVVHRDIKPENVLLETEDPACLTVKLADFGIAAFIQPSRRSSWTGGAGAAGGEVNGSLPYMAPEMFTKDWNTLVKQSQGSWQLLGAPDLWSCGVLIHFMLSGQLPFGESEAAICSGEPPKFSDEVWRSISVNAVDLVRRLLNPDIQARWTAQQALRHDWFRRTNSAAPAVHSFGMGLPGQVDGTPQHADGRNELARGLLRCLKRWQRMPQLKRIAVAAIAKRLESDHPSQRTAQSIYRTFNPSGDKLRCDQLVFELDAALREALATPTEFASSYSQEEVSEVDSPFPMNRDSTGLSFSSERSASSSGSSSVKGNRTLTGLHVRRNIKAMVRRLSRLSEETPTTGGSPGAGRSPGMLSDEQEDLVSLTELKYLIDKLDGAKNGIVDYTLVVATLLPPDVYHDDARIEEVFDAFDFRQRGSIKPEDLQTFLSAGMRAKELRHFAELISPFDLKGDGALDFDAFRRMMVQDSGHWGREGGA